MPTTWYIRIGTGRLCGWTTRGLGAGAAVGGGGLGAWGAGALCFCAELQPVRARAPNAANAANFATRGILSLT